MDDEIWEGGLWGSIVLILLALMVMTGWWTETIWMVTGYTTFAPMYFNTAVLLLLLGIGIFLHVLGLRRSATFFAVLGGLISFILFTQRQFEFEWGLDHLLYTVPEELAKELNTGRCGLNTLFSFTCEFISLFFLNRKTMKTIHLVVVGIFSGLALAIAIVTFWGYVSGMEAASSWGDQSRMAFLTAIGLSIASVLFLMIATKKLTEIDKSILPIWSSALVGLILFSTTIAFTRALALHQTSSIHQLLESRDKELGRILVNKITNVTTALDRLSKRSFRPSNYPTKEWRKDVINHLKDIKGLVGVVKVSDQGDIIQKKWAIFPNKKQVEADIYILKAKVVETENPTIHLSVFANEPHLIYLTPKGEKNNHEIGVISLNDLLEDLIPEFTKKETALTVTIDGIKIYQINANDVVYEGLKAEVILPIYNTKWHLIFWPTTKFIEEQQNYFPITAFLFGSLISMFVSLLTYIALRSLEESRLVAARNMARSAFLTQVSHELRTPLSGIIASVDILENKIEDPKQLRILEIMRSSGQHLLTVVNEVLDLAKLEAGKIPLESSIQNVNLIAKDLITLLMPKANEKGINLQLDCKVPNELYIDPTRLRQILSNLVGNAIKFTEKGDVFVRISYSDVLERGKLKIEVEDTGIGISKENQEHLFEKFSPAYRRSSQGTGLGLYITRAIIEIMGGTISFTSEPEVGSTFTVVLPVERASR